jgi:hypothetical protein
MQHFEQTLLPAILIPDFGDINAIDNRQPSGKGGEHALAEVELVSATSGKPKPSDNTTQYAEQISLTDMSSRRDLLAKPSEIVNRRLTQADSVSSISSPHTAR